MSILKYHGKEEDRKCIVCDRLVAHEEFQAQSFKGKFAYYWLAIPHVGMCGLPCIGGGVSTPGIVQGYFHDRDCEACKKREME